MYVILVYDVNVTRVNKIMKICRQFLFHVQNSVFEGEISEANLVKLKNLLKNKIDDREDSVIIFQFESLHPKYSKREIIGCEKRPASYII